MSEILEPSPSNEYSQAVAALPAVQDLCCAVFGIDRDRNREFENATSPCVNVAAAATTGSAATATLSSSASSPPTVVLGSTSRLRSGDGGGDDDGGGGGGGGGAADR